MPGARVGGFEFDTNAQLGLFGAGVRANGNVKSNDRLGINMNEEPSAVIKSLYLLNKPKVDNKNVDEPNALTKNKV